MITADELDAIEQRAQRASKEPWMSFVEGRDHWGGDNFIRVGEPKDNEPDMYISRAQLRPASVDDQDFIANARQDVPRLIAEVRRLRTSGGESSS
jgi:hypothetical protein